MREVIVTGKTVEEATEKACLELGLPREEVSIEILEMPTRKLFKSTPAKVKATADEAEAPAAEEKPAAPKAEVKPEAPKAPEKEPEAPKAEPVVAEAAAPAQETAEEKPVTEAQQAKLDAAVAYLKTVFAAMGAGEVTVTTSKQGEACIIRVEGDDVGMLIGHRGETMESLSYLASLVANRLPGEYIKLGLDVAGYRGKREKDLEALARRMGAKVARTGRSWAMDPMNPYERRIIHSTISGMEGVRSESKGEGADRRVVIYPTDPQAAGTAFERERRGERGGRGGRGGKGRGDKGRKGGERRSSVPAREFADTPREEGAAPMAPKRTQLFDDAEGFALYGKIEL